MTIAYLNSEYPSLSHTFIEREIRALRARGVDIRTFSVRPATKLGAAGAAHSAAAAETVVLQAGAATLFKDLVVGTLTRPLGVIRALVESQRLSPPGLSYRLRHGAYVVQGIRLARLVRPVKIRHIHVHMANNGAAVAMLACVYDPRLSYSLSIHGSAEFFHVDSWTLGPKVERAAFVRCISNFCRAQIMAWSSPSCWDRLHIVHCGVDPDAYTPRPARKPGAGPLRILTVGRLHSIKGYEVLLRACARLAQAGLNFHLDMVGDGPLMAQLRALAASLGIAEHVTFSGGVDQDKVGAHYDRADVMVVSSFMEGVPVVLMEAMAKRLAVISSRVGGVPELVRDGVDGTLVDPGSVESLAAALAPLARDPDSCARFGASARERILDDFSIDGLGDGMHALFSKHSLISTPAAEPGSPARCSTARQPA